MAAVIGVAVLLGTIAIDHGEAQPGGVAPVQFASTLGWQTGTTKARACPGVSADRCTEAGSWASTVGWKDCRNCVPHQTLSTLPRNGIILAVSRVRERPVVATRQVAWPLRIRPQEVTAGIEGIPSRYGVYQLFARLPNRDSVRVWGYFGRSRPTTAQLQAANTQLRMARLP